jgi:hypothetical protein
MPFEPSKDTEPNNSNFEMDLRVAASAAFPSVSALLDGSNPSTNRFIASSAFHSVFALDDLSPSTNRRGRSSGSNKSRREFLSGIINDALVLIDDDLDSCSGDSDSNSNDQ